MPTGRRVAGAAATTAPSSRTATTYGGDRLRRWRDRRTGAVVSAHTNGPGVDNTGGRATDEIGN